MLENGTIIDGKYEILSKIGQGGMSVVYLAMNRKANKQWAVKEVRKDGQKDFEVVKQGLIAETDILKKLHHPNLPSIIDIIETGDTFLIIMDFIEGKPLSDTLREYGAQPQEYVVEWAKQLCDVLNYLHTRTPPIVYRDTKPSNIMLKPDGSVTMIDFGTAREYKEQNMADTTCLGTQGYAAPEQYGGHGQTDARTDIYNLGATMYHLVTGHNPCEPPYELYPIRQWNPALSEGLEMIILKCTQRNPEDRYQNCMELLYDLENYNSIDSKSRMKKKRKLAGFSLCLIFMLFFLFMGIFSQVSARNIRISDYNSKLETAGTETDSAAKEKLYLDAIQINPSDEEAYLQLIKEYKSDGSFTTAEEQAIQKLRITTQGNQKILDYLKYNNPEGYAKFCYELGTAYWFSYEKEESQKTSAAPWFEEVVSSEQSSAENRAKAAIFRDIGNFQKEIRTLQNEENDSGRYMDYWNKLKALKEEDDKNPDSESMRVRLYKEIVTQIYDYARHFRDDGVSKKELFSMLDSVEGGLSSIRDNNEKEKANQVKALCQDTRGIVQNIDQREGE